MSINRRRNLQAGDSGSSVMLSRVKPCLGRSREGHSVRLRNIMAVLFHIRKQILFCSVHCSLCILVPLNPVVVKKNKELMLHG